MDLILVASNDLRTQEDFKAALSVQGWWVAAVEDRQGALQAAADQAPRLVIVDSDLEGAVDLVAAFGTLNGGPGILACGGEPESAETLRLHEAGVDGVVTKPVRAGEVVAAVERVVSGPRTQAAPPAPPPTRRLTTAEIFGDVLKDLDVEPDVGTPVEAETGMETGAAEPPGPPPPLPAEPPPAVAASPPAAEMPPLVPALPLAAEPTPPEPLPPPALEPALELPAPAPAAAEAATPVPDPAAAEVPAVELPAPMPAAELQPPPAAPSAAPAAPLAVVGGGEDAEKRQAADGLFEETTAASSPAAFDFGEPLSPPPLPLDLDELGPLAAGEARVSTPRAEAPPAVAEESTAEGLRGFGQYQLEERIAVGGMAEVWKARLVGVAGFRKTVALKRILPELTEHRSFVDMFVDEAKLAAGLKHRNIVDIYDLGRIGADYFIAMEFVEGRDLRRILEKARSLGRRIPLPLAVLIGSRLAAALHHAHRQRDGSGRPLGIVHRDVSPRNILMGVEGSVKLCDFGVAKAVTIVSRTQFGALKGKIPYMSPEQARGEPVDSRSDIFSLGTVLFELVTGQRPFVGESEISLLEAVRKCETPDLRQLEPAAPEKLGQIVARALRGDPGERYQSAGDLQRDLDGLLRTFRPAPDEEHLAAWVEYLFQPETSAGDPGERVAGGVDPVYELPELAAAEPGAVEGPSGVLVAGLSAGYPFEETGSGGRPRRWLYGAVAAGLLVASGLALATLGGRQPAEPEPPRAAVEAAPSSAPEVAAPEPAVAPGDPVRRRIEDLVDQRLERREEELRRAFEEEEKQLLEELRRLRAEDKGAQQAPG